MWNKMYYYFHSRSSGFNSTLNVLLHFLLRSLSRPVGFTKLQSSIDSPFSHWQGRNSWSSISPGTYLCWIPINYPCSDFPESALSPLLLKQNMICSWMKNAVECLIPPQQCSWKSMSMLWCRCYYNASLNLLKNGPSSFVFSCFFDSLLSGCVLSNPPEDL